MKKNNNFAHFWKVVEYLAGSNLLYDGGDYKIEYATKVTRRYMDGGDWKSDTIVYQEPKQLFYLTLSRVFSLYKSQCLREGDKPMPEATIEYYLKNSKAFLFETKKESFKKIDPKTGKQETTEDGKNKRTSTTAFVFDYSMLNVSIETGHDAETDEHTPEASQQQMSFKENSGKQPGKEYLHF